MALNTVRHLDCDVCGSMTHEFRKKTAAQVRAWARANGWHWTRSKGKGCYKDICPDCWSKRPVPDNSPNFKGKGGTNIPKGAVHHRAVLTDDNVREIRRLRTGPNKVKLRIIADRFGIHTSQVHRIAIGESWRHVK